MVSRPKARHRCHKIQITSAFSKKRTPGGDPMVHVPKTSWPPPFPVTVASRGLPAECVEAPYQSRTLHTCDSSGTPLELCASMSRVERVDQKFEALHGGGALRFDHYQVTAPDVEKAASFYAEFGFRIVDYMVTGDVPIGVFLHVKDTPYDVVFIRRPGPALHHFAYIVGSINDIIKACDVAGSLGYGDNVEFGPGRHSLGHSYYVYLLDPDGHRVELLPPPIYYG